MDGSSGRRISTAPSLERISKIDLIRRVRARDKILGRMTVVVICISLTRDPRHTGAWRAHDFEPELSNLVSGWVELSGGILKTFPDVYV